jgi:hypothetical protein
VYLHVVKFQQLSLTLPYGKETPKLSLLLVAVIADIVEEGRHDALEMHQFMHVSVHQRVAARVVDGLHRMRELRGDICDLRWLHLIIIMKKHPELQEAIAEIYQCLECNAITYRQLASLLHANNYAIGPATIRKMHMLV